MDNYTKELYVQDVEFIYNNILNPKSMKEINKLEESLKRAVTYKDSFENDTDNFRYHLSKIEEIKRNFKEKIKYDISTHQATIDCQKNIIKNLEAKLDE